MKNEDLHDILDTGMFGVDSGRLRFAKTPDLSKMNILAEHLGETKYYFPLNKSLGDLDEIAENHRDWISNIRSANFWTDLFELSAPDNLLMFREVEELVVEFNLYSGMSKNRQIVQFKDETLFEFVSEIINNFNSLKTFRVSVNRGRKGRKLKGKMGRNSGPYRDALDRLKEQLETCSDPKKKGCEFVVEL